MEILLFLATGNGVTVCRREGENWQEVRRGLEGQRVTSVIAREGVILAGTVRGVYRSHDLGKTWQNASAGITIPYVRWLAYHPNLSDFEFAGTEPAGIFVSQDGAETWRECLEVAHLRDTNHWYLPYSPRAGCVRGFAFNGSRAYAAVEVGGVLRSGIHGETWRLAGGSNGDPNYEPSPSEGHVHPDVHSIEVHPSSPDLVLAPTGGGFYRSTDGGETWTQQYDCYSRAVWCDPVDPGHLILGPADGVDYNGRIEETFDGGKNWSPASAGLDVPWRQHMVERFMQTGQELFAILSNGDLFASPLPLKNWRQILPLVKDVLAATTMEV